MASTYLSRTFGSTGNRKTFTISFWLKRGTIGSDQRIIEADTGTDGNNVSGIEFDTVSGSNRIRVIFYNNPTINLNLKTDALYSDVNGWYHMVLAIDTTQATASNRAKFYVNGEQVTSFETETYPTQNLNTDWNLSGNSVQIGRRIDSSAENFDGSLTHIHMCDGTQYQASDFGETDSTTGIWKPKTAPSVTYGTNGFFLKFENSGAFGTDSSGNGNTFTVNGTMTQTIDTPSNVFATLNSLEAEPNSPTFSNGNLTQTTPVSGGTSGRSTLEIPHSGVWYWEVKIISTTGTIGDNIRLGIATGDQISSGDNVRYISNGTKVVDTTGSSYGASYSAGDIIGVKVDADSNTVEFYKNGTSQGSISYTMDSNKTFKAFVGEYSNTIGCVYSMNFGNGYFQTTAVSSANNDPNGLGIFEYDTDGGYALCTKNFNEFAYD